MVDTGDAFAAEAAGPAPSLMLTYSLAQPPPAALGGEPSAAGRGGAGVGLQEWGVQEGARSSKCMPRSSAGECSGECGGSWGGTWHDV